MQNHLKNERGMALAFMAVAMVAFLAFVVVGVDLSRLAFTATEVQTAADIAATAGARRLYNGGTEAQVRVDALAVVSNQNTVDGVSASQAIQAADVNVGRYDLTTGVFTATQVNPNAVKADGRKTVTNFVAAAFGPSQATTTVHKIAIAAIEGPAVGCGAPEGSGCDNDDWECFCEHGTPPCLPLTSSECEFDSFGQLPPLKVSNDGSDTAAWTGFDEHNASAVRGVLDQAGQPCSNGMGDGPGEQGIGDSINISNGINSSCSAGNQPFGMMGCIVDNQLGCADTNNDGVVDTYGGDTIFSMPIIEGPDDCNTKYNQTRPLVGVATVRVTGACENGVNQVDVQVINYESSNPSRPGGACFGQDCRVTLAE